MLIEVGPNEQAIYEEDLIHEANMRAEKKEKLMKPIRLEVKMELAYDFDLRGECRCLPDVASFASEGRNDRSGNGRSAKNHGAFPSSK